MNRISALLCLSLCLATAPARAQSLTVFAAASLRGALEDIAASYPEPVTLSFGGSGTMAQQVASGAPVDVVVLAHPNWMSWLSDKGLLQPGSQTNVAANTLVLIAAAPSPLPQPFIPDTNNLLSALKGGRIAMGQRDAVPAGIFAREWLLNIGAWEVLQSHLAETDNVRAALALVAQRATPLGIVYGSDAVAEARVTVVYAIPPDQHSPITYPAAALTPRGIPFVTFLRSPDAAAIFAMHGFAPPPDGVSK